MWVAGKQCKVKRGEQYVTVKGGDPLPEAANWPPCWARFGYAIEVPDEPAPAPKATLPPPALKPEVVPEPSKKKKAAGTKNSLLDFVAEKSKTKNTRKQKDD